MNDWDVLWCSISAVLLIAGWVKATMVDREDPQGLS